MKFHNYLPEMASRYPNLFLYGIESIMQKIKGDIRKQKSIYRASRDLGIKENTLRDFLNSKSLPRLSILTAIQKYTGKYYWDIIFEKAKYISGKTFTNKIKLLKTITPEIGYIAGMFRDGGLSDHKCELVISQKDRKWLENVSDCINEVFEINTKIYGPRKKDGCYYIKYGSVALYALFYILLDYTKFGWDTPKIVLNNKHIQKEYIRGFWEAEGSIRSGISFHQCGDIKNCEVLEDIKTMLKSFNIESWLRGPYIRKGYKPIWTLYVPKKCCNLFLHIFKPRHRKLTLVTANSDRLKVA